MRYAGALNWLSNQGVKVLVHMKHRAELGTSDEMSPADRRKVHLMSVWICSCIYSCR